MMPRVACRRLVHDDGYIAIFGLRPCRNFGRPDLTSPIGEKAATQALMGLGNWLLRGAIFVGIIVGLVSAISSMQGRRLGWLRADAELGVEE